MSQNPNQNQGQDPHQQSQYGSGYGGYSGQQYGQQSGYQQSSQPQEDDQQSPYGQQQQQQGYQQSSYDQGQQQQQYSNYQPPLSAATGTSAHDPTSTGLNARTEALLSYVLWWLTGGIFFLIERKNRFVRFHAAQSFVFLGSVSIVLTLLHLISLIPILGFILSFPLACATGIVGIPAALIWLFLMIQAYRGVTVRLPFFADYAERLVARFTSKKKSVI